MSETGGPVYEGSSARPEKLKSGVVEKVKAAFAKKGEEIKKELEVRKNFGKEKQQRVIERYQKVVDGMNESMLKSAVKLYEPVVRADALVKGVNAGVLDTSVKTILKYSRHVLSALSVTGGMLTVSGGVEGNKKLMIGGALGAIGAGVGAIGVEAKRQKMPDIRPVQTVVRKHEDIKDYIGLKGVDILNKIIGRKEAPVATPA